MPSLAAAQDYSAVQSNGNLQLRGYGTFFMPGNTHFVDTLAQAPGSTAWALGDQPDARAVHVAAGPKRQKACSDRHRARLLLELKVVADHARWTDGLGRVFVRQGFDTYLGDQVSRARSGFDATKYNEVRNGALPD